MAQDESFAADTKKGALVNYQSPQYNHQQLYHHQQHHQQQVQHHQILHAHNQFNVNSTGLPLQYNLNTASALQPHTQSQCRMDIAPCSQHQRPQPIFHQVYQTLQSYPQTDGQTKFTVNNHQNAVVVPQSQQQHIFVSHNPLNYDRRSDLIQQYQNLPTISATIPQLQTEKSSMLSTQFILNSPPSVNTPVNNNAEVISSVNDDCNGSASNIRSNCSIQWPQEADAVKTTTNQRSKLVGSSITSSETSSPEGKFKSYLAQLVLASNIPFAYAVIMVAFLITFIASTSIITILTIVLTITGYTAYPVTENTFSTSLAIGVVCATFALVLVIASLIVWRRHCQAAYYYLDDPQTASRGTNSPQLSETYDDSEYGSIPVGDWAKHVQKLHADSDVGFSRQFVEIQKASSPNLSSEHSQLLENKQKNRYINIVAYDHTRVTLRPLPGQKKLGSDYINANFIDGYNKPRAYIGTQGPLVSTFDDYWRMIWEQRVVIIVMITNLQERGRRKCDMYWPKEGTETYGHIQVKLLQEVVMATYTLRTFTAKNLKMKKRNGAERTVYQYHYTNWPDHGVPDHPLPVLSFVRKSASANPPGAGAIICHCSAGCGRSGTYIVIDAMLKQIRHRQSINVVDFLKHIRNQRNFLVQTEEQYVFIHDALVEAIESGDTEIASNFIAKYIQLLQTGGTSTTINQKNSTYSIAANGAANQSLNDCRQQALSVTSDSNQLIANSQSNLFLAANGGATIGSGGSKSNVNTASRSQSSIAGQWSLLERQYRLVASFKAKDFNVVSALKPCNKIKNRTLNLIPLEAHRVHITQKPGVDGSDYINATFLMGFNHLREFIVTQHPVYETFSDFWQMVYDHNSQTIVLLTQMNDLKEYPQFWPQKEDEVDYGSFKVKLIQESTTVQTCDERCVIVTRDFIMRSNQDDYELQTRIIHCPGWPDTCGPLSKVFDLIQVVQNATQQQASQQKLHDGHNTSTTVTIGQEHEPQNGGPIIVVDKHGGTEAATFAVLTTLFKQINFEDAVDVYMYAKLAHLRRPGIWSSQDDYLFLYRAIENYASSCLAEAAAANNTSSQGAQASIIPAINFHHQTMTLDRHKHKSANASLKGTSTMRRQPSSQANGNQSANLVNFDSTLTGSNKNKNQLLLDHNHNQVEPQNVAQQSIASNHMMERKMMANQAQLIKTSLPNNATSPYSSAVSIGTSPHRHLLATNGNRNSTGQQLPIQQQQQQQPDMDHYLYPMN